MLSVLRLNRPFPDERGWGVAARSACQRGEKASGPSLSAATKLLLLKDPDVGALYVCLRAVVVSSMVSAG